jgi:hypothetical protein
MTHSRAFDLKGEFPKTVNAAKEPAVYWDKDVKFVGLRITPDGKKTWMVHDWCGGCRELGDYPAIPNFHLACNAAGSKITNHLEELVNIVIDHKLPISIAKDAIAACQKLING